MNQEQNKTPASGYALDSNGNLVNWLEIVKTVASSVGEDGSKVISNTELTSPDSGKIFFCFEGLEGDAVIESAVGNSENIAGSTIGKHGKIYGKFSNVKLTSGKIIAYMREG